MSLRSNRFALILFCISSIGTCITASSATDSAPFDLFAKVHETPFSFRYDGKSSNDFLSSWKRSESKNTLPDGVEQTLITYSDPQTKLQVVREILWYPKWHAAEWLLRIKNNGDQDSPLLEEIRPLDIALAHSADESVIFHSAYASPYGDRADYTPIEKPLHVDGEVRTSHYFFQNHEHSFSYIPFFNLQGENGGLIGAIGWTGQWMLHVERSENSVRVRSGQETNHFRLHPGEEVRTPRILLLQWEGKDRFVGHNALRQLLSLTTFPELMGRSRYRRWLTAAPTSASSMMSPRKPVRIP